MQHTYNVCNDLDNDLCFMIYRWSRYSCTVWSYICDDLDNNICFMIYRWPRYKYTMWEVMGVCDDLDNDFAFWFTDDLDTSVQCEKLWESVMTLIISLIQVMGEEALVQLTPVCTRQWHVIAGKFRVTASQWYKSECRQTVKQKM